MHQILNKFRDEISNSWDVVPLLLLSLLQPYVILTYHGFQSYAQFQTLILFCVIFEPLLFFGTTPSILRQLVLNNQIKVSRLELSWLFGFSAILLMIGLIDTSLFFVIIVIDVFRSFFLQAAVYLKEYYIASLARLLGPSLFLAGLLFLGVFEAYLMAQLISGAFLVLWFFRNINILAEQKIVHARTGVVLYSLLKVLRANMDKLLVLLVLGKEALGIYRLATHLLSLSQRFTSRIGQVLVATVLKQRTYDNQKIMAFIVGLIYFTVALASPIAVEYLYDTKVELLLVMLACGVFLLQYLIGNSSAKYLRQNNYAFLNKVNALGIILAVFSFIIFVLNTAGFTSILLTAISILLLQWIFLEAQKAHDS